VPSKSAGLRPLGVRPRHRDFLLCWNVPGVRPRQWTGTLLLEIPARFPLHSRGKSFRHSQDLASWSQTPFMGAGTTLVEARALGRRAAGTDISRLAVFSCRDEDCSILSSGTSTCTILGERSHFQTEFALTVSSSPVRINRGDIFATVQTPLRRLNCEAKALTSSRMRLMICAGRRPKESAPTTLDLSGRISRHAVRPRTTGRTRFDEALEKC
jgi:hypothetical protein